MEITNPGLLRQIREQIKEQNLSKHVYDVHFNHNGVEKFSFEIEDNLVADIIDCNGYHDELTLILVDSEYTISDIDDVKAYL